MIQEETESERKADTSPPKPNPAQINIMPALQWSRIYIEEEETDTEHPDAGYYWRLNVTVTACIAEDLEGTTPVWYKAVIIPADSESVPADEYGTSATCTVKLIDDIPEEEAIGENYSYSGTPTALDQNGDTYTGAEGQVLTYWRFGISHGGALHEGDSVYFPDGLTGTGDGVEYEIANVAGNDSFDIEEDSTPAAVSDLSIWDISGYNLKDWEDETAYGWTVKVITKDDEGNETDYSNAESIEAASQWPLERYLEISGYLSLAEYIQTLDM